MTAVVTKISLPQSVLDALHIAAIRSGGGMLTHVTRDAVQMWIDKLTAIKIVNAYIVKEAGARFGHARGPIKKGYHAILGPETIVRYGVRIDPDLLDQLGNIAYWRGVYRSQVCVEALAFWLSLHDPDGTWAPWVFDYPGAIIPQDLKINKKQNEAYIPRAFAKDNRISFANPNQDRPNGGRHA